MSDPIDWIAERKAIELFLSRPGVVQLLEVYERKHIGELKKAQTSQDLFRAQARLNALDEFVSALQVGMDTGEAEAIKQERATQKATREKGLLG